MPGVIQLASIDRAMIDRLNLKHISLLRNETDPNHEGLRSITELKNLLT
jgi:hypothetical protein